MMKFKNSIISFIGNTPLVELKRIVTDTHSKILAKLEYFNPGGSIKDRAALFMVRDAEKRGVLKSGGTLVESSSGNTGAALAMIAIVKGYKCTIVISDKMSEEKINFMKSFGAEVIITPAAVRPESPESYYSVAKRIAQETPGAYYTDQFHNKENIEAHYCMTGPEIWKQTNGEVDIVIAGMGTGGTLLGISRFLKEKNPKILIIGVDPIGSVYYNSFKNKKLPSPVQYKVEGIGEDFIPEYTDFKLIDEIIQVSDKDSFLTARKLAVEEGIVAGGSSGSALWASLKIAKELKGKKNIVTIFPDSGTKYLSKIYNDGWMRRNGFI